MRSSTLIQAYHRARFMRRVMLVVFGLMSLGTLLWVLPWVPWGLTTKDFDSATVVPLALAFGAWVSAFGAVYLGDQSNRYEQTLATWSSVHDELGDLRRREYFFEIISMECMRSQQTDIPFAVFAARFGTRERALSADTAHALEALARLVRQTDSLAALGPQEVGVLGAAMGHREAPAFGYRLKSMLEATAGDGQVNVGWAVWGTDGKDAGSLVGLARSRMQRKSAVRELGRSVDAETLPELDTTDGVVSAIEDFLSRNKGRDQDVA